MINPTKIAIFSSAIVLLFLLTECRQKEQIPLCGHVEVRIPIYLNTHSGFI